LLLRAGIVTKIADFGMARDVYKSDYYKKGGKAMIPVKWMPPESFMDGVFCSATDVWSFGIVLWEIFGFGFTPYPGKSNQEVMQYVMSGGRLDRPNSATPDVIWELTQWCWHPIGKQRPTFADIERQLGRCLQNSALLNSPLPRFSANASASNSGGQANEVQLPLRPGLSSGQPQPSHQYLQPVGSSIATVEHSKLNSEPISNSVTLSGNTCSTTSTFLSTTSYPPASDSIASEQSLVNRQLIEQQRLGIVKIRGQALKRLSDMLRISNRPTSIDRFAYQLDSPGSNRTEDDRSIGRRWMNRFKLKHSSNHHKLPGPPSKQSLDHRSQPNLQHVSQASDSNPDQSAAVLHPSLLSPSPPSLTSSSNRPTSSVSIRQPVPAGSSSSANPNTDELMLQANQLPSTECTDRPQSKFASR
jgi:hypothetical protein